MIFLKKLYDSFNFWKFHRNSQAVLAATGMNGLNKGSSVEEGVNPLNACRQPKPPDCFDDIPLKNAIFGKYLKENCSIRDRSTTLLQIFWEF